MKTKNDIDTMKKILFILFLMGASVTGFSQIKDYMVFEGKIDKIPVRMNLYLVHSSNPDSNLPVYDGYYSYNSQEIPIKLSGSELEGNHLELTNYGKYDPDTDNSIDEVFSGTLADGVYKGTWTNGLKNFNFELREVDNVTRLVHLKNSRIVPVKKTEPEFSVEGTFDFDWYLPENDEIQMGLIQQLELDNYTGFFTFTNAIFDQFETDYKEEIEEYLKDSEIDSDFFSFTWNYAHSISITPMANNSKYLVMEYSGYDYTGGAHGYYYSVYYTYDKQKNKWLTIDDVLIMSQKDEILKVLDAEVRKQYKIPVGKSLSEGGNSIFIADEMTFSDNFTLAKKGITFHYGLYELTPYVYGLFDITVPYEALKPYLQPGFAY